MGRWMAANLLKAGFSLTVCDLDINAVRTLMDLGAESAAAPAELSTRVDRIFLCLPNKDRNGYWKRYAQPWTPWETGSFTWVTWVADS